MSYYDILRHYYKVANTETNNWFFEERIGIEINDITKPIIDGFFNRHVLDEMCTETLPLWEHKVRYFFDTEIPMYIKRLDAINIYSPLEDIKYKETHATSETATSTTDSNTEYTGSDTTTHADTPQGLLSGLTNNKYMSSADISKGTNNTVATENAQSNRVLSYTTEKSGHLKSNTQISLERLKVLETNLLDEIIRKTDNLFIAIW